MRTHPRRTAAAALGAAALRPGGTRALVRVRAVVTGLGAGTTAARTGAGRGHGGAVLRVDDGATGAARGGRAGVGHREQPLRAA